MIRGLRGVSVSIVFWILCGIGIAPSGAASKQIAPFVTELSVRWGDGAGSDAFRGDLSRSLAETLATECFESVRVATHDSPTSTSDLLLTVVLSNVVDETRFDESLAATLQPDQAPKAPAQVARFEVAVDVALSAHANGALVKTKHLFAGVSRRPLVPGDDAQEDARSEAIDIIVNDVKKALGCGGSKLSKKIRDALAATGPGTPAPR